MHNTTLVTHGTLDDMIDLATMQQESQLVFQYVATRDIQPNEELFLDYGNEWEAAWQYHIQHYPYSNHHGMEHDDKNYRASLSNHPPPNPKYISAHEYNYYHQNDLIRTMEEQMVEPYPSNLQIRCHRSLYLQYASAVAIYEWTGKDYGLACRILDRWIEPNIITSSLHMDLYTVQLEYVPSHDVTEKDYLDPRNDDTTSTTIRNMAIWVVRTDVPRSAIRWFDRPYTTDLHQPYTFRHYIQIDDDMFPPQWKNMK
jgi:hypothetical protein